MHAMLFAAVLAAVPPAPSASSVPAAASEWTLIRAGWLVDGKGGVLANAAIWIEGGKIREVGPASKVGALHRAAREIDLPHATVLPGLIDVHVHIGWHFNRDGRLHTEKDGETPVEAALAEAGNASATLRSGFTTVQSVGAPED